MRAILIRCPECGAKLSVKASDKETECEYCGARSQIQHRRGLLERAEPRQAGASKLPFAIQGHSMAWRLAIIGIPTVFVGLIVLMITSERGQRPSPGQQASVAASQPAAVKKPAPARPRWRSPGAALVDINGDGTLDVVGRIHQKKPLLEDKIAAFDGVSGSMLWSSADLNLASDSSPLPFTIAEDTLLFSQSKTSLRGFSLRDGAQLWSVTLPEALGVHCKSDAPGTVNLQTADKEWHSLKLADGSLEPLASAVPPPCQPLAGDSAYLSQLGQLQIDPPFQYAKLSPKSPGGTYVRKAIYDSQGEVMIALAEKSPGTAVPMLVGYQRDQIADRIRHGGLVTLRGKVTGAVRNLFEPEIRKLEKKLSEQEARILWSVAVPSSNPTEAVTGAPTHRNVALQDGVVVVAYTGSSKQEYLSAFNAADGTRLWEVSLNGKAFLSRVVASKGRVYAVRSSGVEVFHLKDGKAAYILPPLPKD